MKQTSSKAQKKSNPIQIQRFLILIELIAMKT